TGIDINKDKLLNGILKSVELDYSKGTNAVAICCEFGLGNIKDNLKVSERYKEVNVIT
ncbi:36052_t:CDS:2, partial [Gigaspora margarita]